MVYKNQSPNRIYRRKLHRVVLLRVKQSSAKIAIEKNRHRQEDDGIGVHDVPPEGLLCGVCEFLFQDFFLFFG